MIDSIILLPELLFTIPFFIGYSRPISLDSQTAKRFALMRKDIYNEQASEQRAWEKYIEEQEKENEKGLFAEFAGNIIGSVIGFVVGGVDGAKAGSNAGKAVGRNVRRQDSEYFDGQDYLEKNPYAFKGKFNKEADNISYKKALKSITDANDMHKYEDLIDVSRAMYTGITADTPKGWSDKDFFGKDGKFSYLMDEFTNNYLEDFKKGLDKLQFKSKNKLSIFDEFSDFPGSSKNDFDPNLSIFEQFPDFVGKAKDKLKEEVDKQLSVYRDNPTLLIPGSDGKITPNQDLNDEYGIDLGEETAAMQEQAQIDYDAIQTMNDNPQGFDIISEEDYNTIKQKRNDLLDGQGLPEDGSVENALDMLTPGRRVETPVMPMTVDYPRWAYDTTNYPQEMLPEQTGDFIQRPSVGIIDTDTPQEMLDIEYEAIQEMNSNLESFSNNPPEDFNVAGSLGYSLEGDNFIDKYTNLAVPVSEYYTNPEIGKYLKYGMNSNSERAHEAFKGVFDKMEEFEGNPMSATDYFNIQNFSDPDAEFALRMNEVYRHDFGDRFWDGTKELNPTDDIKPIESIDPVNNVEVFQPHQHSVINKVLESRGTTNTYIGQEAREEILMSEDYQMEVEILDKLIGLPSEMSIVDVDWTNQTEVDLLPFDAVQNYYREIEGFDYHFMYQGKLYNAQDVIDGHWMINDSQNMQTSDWRQ